MTLIRIKLMYLPKPTSCRREFLIHARRMSTPSGLMTSKSYGIAYTSFPVG